MNMCNDTHSRWQLLVEVSALVVLVLVTARLFSPDDCARLTGALAVAYAVPRAAYTTRRWCTPTGRWVFTALGLVMVALAVLTVWNITVAAGRDMASPRLMSDDGGYFRWALHHYDGRCPEPRVAFPGFPMMMLWMWRLLGVSVVWPQAMNLMFTLLTVVVAAATTRRLLAGHTRHTDTWTGTVGLCMTAVLCYFLSQGLRIQKEAMVYLAIAFTGYVLAGVNNRHPGASRPAWCDLLLWTAACLMLALARTTYLYFAVMGVVIVGVPRWRQSWRFLLACVVLLVPAFLLGNHFASYSVDGHVDIVKGGYHMQKAFMGGAAQQPYLDLVGKYFMYPVWKRLTILPLACCVQFIIPFPWVYEPPTILNMLPRVAWGWYAVGGMVLFYFLMMFRRSGRPLGLGAWPWWLAAFYVVIAYVVAGSVSRYLLPVEPMAVPMAVLVLARLREGHWLKAFKWWSLAYVLTLTVTLVVCYHVQTAYLDALNQYYQSLM